MPQLLTLLEMRRKRGCTKVFMETKLELLFLSRPEICFFAHTDLCDWKCVFNCRNRPQHGESRCHWTSFYFFSLAFSYPVNCLYESVKSSSIKGGRRGCQQLQLCSWMWHGPREPRTLFFDCILVNSAR